MKKVLASIVATTCFAFPSHAQTAGGVGIIEAGAPNRDANTTGDRDYIEVGLLRDKQVHSYGVSVNITETMTPAEKAVAIKDAIEGDEILNEKVSVSVQGHVVTMSAKAPYEGLRALGTKGKPKETGNRAGISYPATALAAAAPEPDPVGRVIMFGAMPRSAGYVVQVGTDRWVGTWDPSQFASVAKMMIQIQSDLVANGINAVLENPWSLKLVLDPTLDGGLRWGNSAPDIEQWISVGHDDG